VRERERSRARIDACSIVNEAMAAPSEAIERGDP
jgi:hypothetical protein